MEQLLRRKLRRESTGRIENHSLFVGLAPDSGPRVYERNWAWDLGFMILTPELLSYQGEESEFSLARGDISSIYLGPGPTGWFTTPSVYIAWRDRRPRGRIQSTPAGWELHGSNGGQDAPIGGRPSELAGSPAAFFESGSGFRRISRAKLGGPGV